MKKRSFVIGLLILLAAAFIIFNFPQPRTNPINVTLVTEVLVENLDTVWAIDFLPDERMMFTERPGRVNIYNGVSSNVLSEIDVSERAESGLMGIAVDPEFSFNKFIYLYYTYELNGNTYNRVSRFVLTKSIVKEELVNETILIDRIPSALYHDGGRIKFGPDEKLYITTGDATVPSSAQDTSSLAGKILRINRDGSVPNDNPFENYVWSYGHRNPQGLAWDNELMYSSEHGPIRNDEINIITRGQNYGWPNECISIGDWTNPFRCFTEFTIAPGGIAFYKGILYVAGLRGTQLRKLTIEKGNILKEEELFTDLGRIRDVVVHNGYLYVGTSNKDGRGIQKQGDDKIIMVKI